MSSNAMYDIVLWICIVFDGSRSAKIGDAVAVGVGVGVAVAARWWNQNMVSWKNLSPCEAKDKWYNRCMSWDGVEWNGLDWTGHLRKTYGYQTECLTGVVVLLFAFSFRSHRHTHTYKCQL